MVRLRSNRRTSANRYDEKQEIEGEVEEDLESLLQVAVKSLRTGKVSAKVNTPSKTGEGTNDNPPQPLFIKDAKILNDASLHSGLRDFKKRRTGICN